MRTKAPILKAQMHSQTVFHYKTNSFNVTNMKKNVVEGSQYSALSCRRQAYISTIVVIYW